MISALPTYRTLFSTGRKRDKQRDDRRDERPYRNLAYTQNTPDANQQAYELSGLVRLENNSENRSQRGDSSTSVHAGRRSNPAIVESTYVV